MGPHQNIFFWSSAVTTASVIRWLLKTLCYGFNMWACFQINCTMPATAEPIILFLIPEGENIKKEHLRADHYSIFIKKHFL